MAFVSTVCSLADKKQRERAPLLTGYLGPGDFYQVGIMLSVLIASYFSFTTSGVVYANREATSPLTSLIGLSLLPSLSIPKPV